MAKVSGIPWEDATGNWLISVLNTLPQGVQQILVLTAGMCITWIVMSVVLKKYSGKGNGNGNGGKGSMAADIASVRTSLKDIQSRLTTLESGQKDLIRSVGKLEGKLEGVSSSARKG